MLIIIHFTNYKINVTKDEPGSTSVTDKYGSPNNGKFFSSDKDYIRTTLKRQSSIVDNTKAKVQNVAAKIDKSPLHKAAEKPHASRNITDEAEKMKENATVARKPVFTVVRKRAPPKHYITVDFQGRLGNLLYQYASLFGIAQKNYLIPVIPEKHDLRRIFKISAQSTEKNPVHYEKVFKERVGCAFEPAAMTLGSEVNTKIIGYFQSFKYFQEHASLIRREFTFQDDIRKNAESQFNALISNSSRGSSVMTYIAVHVRRGDFVHNQHFQDYGYISADANYLQKGMAAFRANHSNVLFIVGADEMDWCQENMKGDDIRFIKPGNRAEVDIAIMMRCNHTLMTVGSYGWWTAWMNNGKTIYFNGYPRPNSQLAKQIVLEDYRPPEWIGMS